MGWTTSGSIQLSRDWQYTEPITKGSYFRLKHTEAPNGGLFAIAQCEVDSEGKLSIGDSQVLAVEKGISDIIKLPKTAYTDRRIAIKKITSQPNLEQEIRRLILPNLLAPIEQEINFVRRNNWQVDIEVSNYIEADTVQADYSDEFADVTARLIAIETKINNIDSNGGTSPPTNTNSTKYKDAILLDTPVSYWRLGETTGTVAADIGSAANTGTYTGNYTLNSVSSLSGDSDPSVLFNGAGFVQTSLQQSNPQVFSLEARIKTTAANAGILGFGASPDANSSSYDRSLYLNAGKVVFMIFSNSARTIVSPSAVNDGNWHSIVVTLSNLGQELYIDGSLVASNPDNTSPASYDGFWHLGFTTMVGYFQGNLDEVSVYNKKLSSSRILAHHQAAN